MTQPILTNENILVRERGEIDPTQRLAMSSARLAILEILVRYRYVTPSLLGIVYEKAHGRGAYSVRNQLTALWRAGYVERHYYATRPPGLGGSEEFVYVATPKGAKEVLTPERYRVAKKILWNRVQRKSNAQHLLLGSTLQILLSHAGQPWALEAFLSDQEDRNAAIRFPLQSWQIGEREALRRRGRTWQEAYIHPDATALIGLPNGKRVLLHFEIDRTHKELALFNARFQDYAAYSVVHRDETLRAWERDFPGGAVTGIVPVCAVPAEADCYRMAGYAKAAIERLRERDVIAKSDLPPFLFWPMNAWSDGGRLRDPVQIMAEPQLMTLSGKRRSLIAAA